MSEQVVEPQAGRADLDPRAGTPLQGGAVQETRVRVLFAAEHPFLYLSSMVVAVAGGLLLLAVVAGLLGHGLLDVLLWAWRLVP